MHSNRDARWMSYIVCVRSPGAEFTPRGSVAHDRGTENTDGSRRTPGDFPRVLPPHVSHSQKSLYSGFRSVSAVLRKNSRPAFLTLHEEWTLKKQKFPKKTSDFAEILINDRETTLLPVALGTHLMSGTPMSMLKSG